MFMANANMVDIDEEIYARIKNVVETNPVEWATIKQFVNLNCLKALDKIEKKEAVKC